MACVQPTDLPISSSRPQSSSNTNSNMENDLLLHYITSMYQGGSKCLKKEHDFSLAGRALVLLIMLTEMGIPQPAEQVPTSCRNFCGRLDGKDPRQHRREGKIFDLRGRQISMTCQAE